MTKSGALKRYNSGIKNVHERLNDSSKDGTASRKKYYALTGNKIYLEKNYRKAIEKGKATGISITVVKHDWKTIRDNKKEVLSKEYDRLKKEKTKGLSSKKDYIYNNLHDDLEFQDIRELFNSA